MTAITPTIDLRCAICLFDTNYQKAFGRVFYKGKCYCSFRCYSEASMKAKQLIYKICIVCKIFISDYARHNVEKGMICSNKCFHLWLNDGFAKFRAHMNAKTIHQKEKNKVQEK